MFFSSVFTLQLKGSWYQHRGDRLCCQPLWHLDLLSVVGICHISWSNAVWCDVQKRCNRYRRFSVPRVPST